MLGRIVLLVVAGHFALHLLRCSVPRREAPALQNTGGAGADFGTSVSISTSDTSEERPAKPAAFLIFIVLR